MRKAKLSLLLPALLLLATACAGEQREAEGEVAAESGVPAGASSTDSLTAGAAVDTSGPLETSDSTP